MIIETHSHLNVGLEDVGKDNFLYGKPVEGIAEYLANYRACGVDACWTFGTWAWRCSDLAPRENRKLAEIGRQYPGKIYPWGSVDPFWQEEQLRDEIRQFTGLGLKGIKLAPVVKGCSLASQNMDIVAGEAGKNGLPVFFHDGSAEYCSAIQVAYFARAHPDLTVVSGHSGLRDYWRDYVETAADIPNLWLCLSGPTQWGIQALYDRLGPERLMFGSDGGLGTPAITKAYMSRIRSLRAPEEHKAMILGGNAQRFLATCCPQRQGKSTLRKGV